MKLIKPSAGLLIVAHAHRVPIYTSSKRVVGSWNARFIGFALAHLKISTKNATTAMQHIVYSVSDEIFSCSPPNVTFAYYYHSHYQNICAKSETAQNCYRRIYAFYASWSFW